MKAPAKTDSITKAGKGAAAFATPESSTSLAISDGLWNEGMARVSSDQQPYKCAMPAF
jgi:hypothetical protein